MQLRALFFEMDDRKCVVLSVVGVDGAQAMYAIFGRRCWYHFRMWEVCADRGWEEVAKRLVEFEK
jgi:hypothetical protein